jgi:predicted nucleic acid-binding protein
MPPERYFIDSNIPMYVHGREHPLKAPCIQTLRRIANEALPCVTSVEVVQEIVHRYIHVGRRHETYYCHI